MEKNNKERNRKKIDKIEVFYERRKKINRYQK